MAKPLVIQKFERRAVRIRELRADLTDEAPGLTVPPTIECNRKCFIGLRDASRKIGAEAIRNSR